MQNGTYDCALAAFGPNTVFLPIPKGTKGPKIKDWQKLTLEQTLAPDFQALLQTAGNIGVLLGQPSANLVDIDLDTDAAVKEFCQLNQDLVNRTLQTIGSRGRHFFFRLKGPYPQKICRLEVPGHEHTGEWRGGGGGQTVAAGTHPKGMIYRIINPVPILEIEFSDIIWPATWLKPSIEDRAEDVIAIFEQMRAAGIDSGELSVLDVPVRNRVIGHWCKDGDLGFIYGERGCGKTWLGAVLACYIARGAELFDWSIDAPRNVLWLDGEMPLADYKERVLGLLAEPVKNLVILHHERFFDLGFGSLNLADRNTQEALTMYCLARDSNVLLIDNLSCLFSGMLENDSDQWEMVLPWLLELRRMKITVIIIHHASRAGTMRGSSKREDSAAWIIKVESVAGRDGDANGAHFTTTFTKQRSGEHPEAMREWTFKTNGDGEVEIGCIEKGFDEQVYELIKLGISSATDIATELGSNKATVSRAAKRMLDRHLIAKSGRNYKCIQLPGES
jgi:hypothetical protein